MFKKKTKEVKPKAKPKAKPKKIETPIEAVPVPPEVEERVNELEQFVAIAEKYGIHRIRHAHHLLGDARKKLEQYK